MHAAAPVRLTGGVRIAMLAGRDALIENDAAKDARIHQLESEVAMLREELRIIGARIKRVPPTPATAAHHCRANGHLTVAGNARLEQNRNRSPLLYL